MLQLQSISKATVGLLLAASFTAAAQSNSLDSLPLASQDEITQICLPFQFRDGAGAYRDCIQSELALRTNGAVTVFEQLSFDDKYAVQQACANAGGQSSQNYQSCVAAEISELNKIAAPSLDELSEDELYVVQQSCFNAQSTQGAAKYRQCLNAELRSVRGIPAADTSNLNMLNKNALQLRCSSTASNAVQYRQCIAEQYESITGSEPSFLPTIPAVQVLNQVAETSSNAVANETLSSNTEQPLNPSISETQNSTSTEPSIAEQPSATDIAALNTDPSNNEQEESDLATALPDRVATPQRNTDALSEPAEAVQAETETESSTPLATQATVTNEISDSPVLSTVAENRIDTVSPNSQRSSSTVEARVISRPELVETLELQQRTNAPTDETESPVGTDSSTAVAASPHNAEPMQKLHELWQKFLDTLSSMDAIGWLLIAALLALPALLLGFFAMLRGLRRTSPAVPEYASPHHNQFDSGPETRRLRHEKDAATLFEDDTFFDDDKDAEHDVVTRIATKGELQHASHRQQTTAYGATSRDTNSYNASLSQSQANGASARPTPNSDGWQSAFSDWLLQQPDASRMEICIEFLVYWVAFGDDRYQPDLKQRLFTDMNLTPHDQIKRWVLEQDVFAFADVVGWLRTNAAQKQLDQCVALLMALLVTENSMTPVQNTVLRFLADAFNIGKHQLEQRFEKAFGHPMPPIPRTDKYAWWAKQQPEFMQRWEARFMATRSENEQMIARLGLTANYDDAQVINAYRRAARRCHPDRFTELGDRERALAAQQFAKFEQARDKLLGVSV